MRTAAAIALLAVALSGWLIAARLSGSEYLDYIKFLASPELKGRGDGTPELDKAAEFLRGRFEALGLKPAPGAGFYQDFPLTTSARLGAGSAVRVGATGAAAALVLERDFAPLNLSASGEARGAMVFAGYGITAPEYRYDDYAGLDVKGKIVMVLRHEPQEFDEQSVFSGKSYTSHAQLFSKASNAKLHGAAALVLVNDAAAHPGGEDALETFGSTAGPGNAGIEFVQVTTGVAAKWIAETGGSLDAIEAGIDRDLHPRSFAFPAALSLDVVVDIAREVRTVHNVAAWLPGERANEYVVVGAHYDHLGLGGQYSLAPSLIGTPHPGADDNASGTAGLLELARVLNDGRRPKRGVLFLAFAGEELGLLGSNYYVNHPLLPLEGAVAMINMDMIGRIRDEKVYVGGSGTGTTFAALLKQAGAGRRLAADLTEQAGYGSSDHTSFTSKQIPTLFFFSGLHADYHRPGDTWDKINADGAIEVLDYVAAVIRGLEEAPSRPAFVRVMAPENAHRASSGSGKGYGPNFGSIPDFTELPNGVRFADILPGSPAERAGLRAGDILTEFDGKPIQNLYDFTYALRAKKPGDEVTVKVLRDKNVVEAKVLLTERK